MSEVNKTFCRSLEINYDGATDGCLGVLVRDVLSCFVSKFSILLKNRELLTVFLCFMLCVVLTVFVCFYV